MGFLASVRRSGSARGTGFGGGRRRPSRSSAAVFLSSTALLAAVWVAEGFTATRVNLDDRAVWVTNSQRHAVGRVNTEIKRLDGSWLEGLSTDLDVAQDGRDVFVHDRGTNTLFAIDPAEVKAKSSIPLPAGARVVSGGGVVAVGDVDAGKLWLRTTDSFTRLEIGGPAGGGSAPDDPGSSDASRSKGDGPAKRTRADARLRPGFELAVSPSGVVATLERRSSRAVVSTFRIEDGRVRRESTADIDPVDPSPTAAAAGSSSEGVLAMVGDTPVVLDQRGARLITPNGRVDLRALGDGVVLQWSGPSSDHAVVASPGGLFSVPLDGGEARRIVASDGGGAPIRPAVTESCVDGAWKQRAQAAHVCGGSVNRRLLDGAEGAALAFRINRNAVVLNNINSDENYVMDEDITKFSNWEEVQPRDTTDDDQGDPDRDTEGDDSQNKLQQNRVPEPQPDDLGARPNQPALLDVLDNDRDPDGDLLTISAVTPPSDPEVHVDVVRDGQRLQLTAGPGAGGVIEFGYEVSDGRNVASTTVRVTLRNDEQNEPPELKKGHRPKVTVEQGKSVSYSALDDWVDPDSDPLSLVGAAVPPDTGDTVRYTAEGLVTFTASGPSAAVKPVALTVSDGRVSAAGELNVDVFPSGRNEPPVVNDDLVTTWVDEPVEIHPLVNDRDPNQDPMNVVKVEEVSGGEADVSSDVETNTVTFSAREPGTYLLAYTVTDDARSGGAPVPVTGRIRVEVAARRDENRPPVAVADTVSVVLGKSSVVDLLANDVDPDGNVLIVLSATPDPASGAIVALVDNRTLRVSLSKPLVTGRLTIPYQVTDGIAPPVTGVVRVVQVPEPGIDQPPVTQPDTAVVRMGDVVDVPVLANDFDPEGGRLRLLPTFAVAPNPSVGYAFADVSRGVVRYVAPATGDPVTVTLSYQVDDGGVNKASETVTLRLVPVGDENHAPTPPTLVARVTAGGTVAVRVPLNGVDPDGDSVVLDGVDQPSRGTAGVSDAAGEVDVVQYRAAPGQGGTDTVTYYLRDARGAIGTGTIRVGIAPRQDVNHDPVATDDKVTIYPGRTLLVDVLANDNDPDPGQEVAFDGPPVNVPDGIRAKVRRAGGTEVLEVRAGTAETEVSFAYRITDGVGGRNTGYLTVKVSADDSAKKPPIARDDPSTRTDVGPAGADKMTFKVLENDSDPDDPGFATNPDVAVSVDLPVAPEGVTASRGTVTVDLGDRPRVVPYQVTDADGNTATAVIRVPVRNGSGAGNRPPVAKKDLVADVEAGGRLTVAVADYIEDPEGKAVVITQDDHVTVPDNAGSVTVQDPGTFVFTAAPEFVGGATAVSFEVTDGTGPDDPDGRKARFTLDVTVRPPKNVPPTFTANPVQVVQAEDAQTIDLRQYVTDPDPGDLDKVEFADARPSDGDVTASLAGSSLKLTASGAVGSQHVVSLTVSDRTNPPVQATVPVVIVKSNRPLVRAVDDEILNANAGQESCRNVVDNDVSPFAGERPVLVPETTGVTGSAGTGPGERLVATPDGRVCYTPPTQLVPEVIITYTVRDRTKDPEREVSGRLRVVVRDRPAKPAPPTVVKVSSHTVELRWVAPAANGTPITRYVVSTDVAGTAERSPVPVPDATSLVFDGLTNGTKYRFKVVAVNEVGPSDASDFTTPQLPDQVPDKPTLPPTLVFGDKALTVTWAKPVVDGTEITKYDLDVSPVPGSTNIVQVAAPALTTVLQAPGQTLVNGTPYRVRYRAINGLGAGAFSEWSSFMTPAGKPPPPTGITVDDDSGGVGSQVKVSWTAPSSNNGDAIANYTVYVFQGSTQVRSVAAGTSLSQNISGLTDNTAYTFEVSATNKAGEGIHSARSASAIPFRKPSTITSVTAADGDGQATLTFTDPASNGRTLEYYEVLVNGSGTPRRLAMGSRTVNGLTNNSAYTFQVRACHKYCADAWSPASNTARPFGAPFAPGVSYLGTSGGNPQFSVSAPARNGRDIVRVEVNYPGSGGWQTANVSSGSQNIVVGASCGTSVTFSARATDATGVVGPTASTGGAASACPPPPPSITIDRGGLGSSSRGTCFPGAGCHWVVVRVRNLSPNSGYRVSCQNPDGTEWWGYPITTDGNGNNDSGDPGGCLMGRLTPFKVNVGPVTSDVISYATN